MTSEEWRKVPGLPEWLEVSNLGNARSLPHPVTVKRGTQKSFTYTAGGKVLSQESLQKGGYPVLQYRIPQPPGLGKHKAFPMHRAVLLAFAGPPPSKNHECCHRDGDPKNNQASNLYWGTRSENVADCRRHGRAIHGEMAWNAKLNAEKVVEIRAATKQGKPVKELAALFGVSTGAISAVVTNKNWKWVP